MNNDKKRITPFPLRLPPDLRKELELSAKENSRSLNAEILYVLSTRFDAEQMIIEGIKSENPKIKNIIKLTMSELFDDLLKEKKVIIHEKS